MLFGLFVRLLYTDSGCNMRRWVYQTGRTISSQGTRRRYTPTSHVHDTTLVPSPHPGQLGLLTPHTTHTHTYTTITTTTIPTLQRRRFADKSSTEHEADEDANQSVPPWDATTTTGTSRTTTTKTTPPSDTAHQRVWTSQRETYEWHDRILDEKTLRRESLYAMIEAQKDHSDKSSGGRMKSRQLGVLHEDPATDMQLLTQNYTLPAVASALRDREDVLQQAAVLADEADWPALQRLLRIYHPRLVLERRQSGGKLNVTALLDDFALERLRKTLGRMPRTVVAAHSQRAAVVIPLCTVHGVPSLLLEKRASHLRAHPNQVCLPGGKVCEIADRTIVNTCLREMKEEIGGLEDQNIAVLGVFRTNWGEVHHLVGVAVTPVVCYLGELPPDLYPNPDEVAQVFTIPLRSLVDQDAWVYKEGRAPIFLGGPHVIWGLTGYILDRFAKDILVPNSRPDGTEEVVQSEDLLERI